MEYMLIVIIFVLLALVGALARALQLSLNTTQGYLGMAMSYKKSASEWKRFAQQIHSLAMAKEGIHAVLDGIDMVMEHPDAAEQAEANRLMTDLKRLAEELSTARAIKTKGSTERN